MISFLEIALQCAAHGWYVLPLRGKFPIIPKSEGGSGYKDATLDETLINKWCTRWPDANVGIACGVSNLFVADCDYGLNSFEDFESWRIRNGIPQTYTVRSGGRDGYRVQMYFSGAISNNQKFEIDGVRGEIRSAGSLVVAAGSIHPDSGEKYEVLIDIPLAPRPAVIEQSVKQLKTALTERKPGELIDENRNMHAVSELGKLRKRMRPTKEAALVYMLQWNADNCAVPLPDDEITELVNKNFRLYPDEPEPPEVQVGKKADEVEVVEELDGSLKAIPLPDYPLEVWEGTLYMEFANRASEGNFIPKEFYIEGAMTFVGAVCNTQLNGFSVEVAPRLFTTLLGMAGAGKGTTFRRMREFIPPHRLFRNISDEQRQELTACTALVSNPASENGLNDALLQHPATILAFEEMDKLMEKTRINGSGAALMSIIRGLFDDTVPEITTCKGRPVAADVGRLSLLGAMTPNIWRRSMEGQDSYGTGLGGRFNLVATNSYKIVPSLMPMELGDVHERLNKKFQQLESFPQLNLKPDKEAFKVLEDWWNERFNGQQYFNRVNVILHRKALHLAWIRNMPVVTADIMRQAIRLAEYLVAVRAAFDVAKGEDSRAINENRVLNILARIYPKAVRQSKIAELLDGEVARSTIYGVLKSLVGADETEEILRKDATCKKPYTVYRLSPKSAQRLAVSIYK